MNKIAIILGFIISQFFVLGVFSDETKYYVRNQTENLCGTFIKGTAEKPNWLQSGWEAIILNPELKEKFERTLECSFQSESACCKKLGLRYAGVPIGTKQISTQRKAAEFLAGKKYINTKSLNPDQYKLHDPISRKEFIKIIMLVSEKSTSQTCERIFQDTPKDWGCNYIESALENEFIAENLFFRPNDNVSLLEAVKLILKARNIPKKYDTGYWEQDYISTAYYLGYIDSKSSVYNKALKRGEVFEILAKSFPSFSSY